MSRLLNKINKSYFNGIHRGCMKKRIRVAGPESIFSSHILVEVDPDITTRDFYDLQNAWKLFFRDYQHNSTSPNRSNHKVMFACTGSKHFPYPEGPMVEISREYLYNEKWFIVVRNIVNDDLVSPNFTFPNEKLIDFMIDSGLGDIRLQELDNNKVGLLVDDESARVITKIALS